MRKVRVLGANGQLARNTVPCLLRDPGVTLTLYLRRAHRLTNPDPARVTIVEGDVLDATTTAPGPWPCAGRGCAPAGRRSPSRRSGRWPYVDPLNRRVEQMLVGVATRRYARSLEPVPASVRSRGTRAERETASRAGKLASAPVVVIVAAAHS